MNNVVLFIHFTDVLLSALCLWIIGLTWHPKYTQGVGFHILRVTIVVLVFANAATVIPGLLTPTTGIQVFKWGVIMMLIGVIIHHWRVFKNL